MNTDNSEEFLALINSLLEQLHLFENENIEKVKNERKIEIVYVASGGQHVETQVIASPCPPPTGGGNTNGREKGTERPALPEALSSEEAMVLWRKVQAAGYVDDNYQPLISRTQAALLADAMAGRLGIREKWKVFEGLWGRKNAYHDYYQALSQRQSLAFQDKLKSILG